MHDSTLIDAAVLTNDAKRCDRLQMQWHGDDSVDAV